jgi:molybdopterin molybdotransferase
MSHIREEGFKSLTSIDDALHLFLKAIGEPIVKSEVVDAHKALGRILGEDIIADRLIPATDRSIMDGYAVRSQDVQAASETNPIILRVVGESKVGEVCRTKLGAGQAVAVATGSMIPSGADTVAILERTKALPGNKIAVTAPALAGQNISKRGEDVAPGLRVLTKGKRLRPQDLGILKALGRSRVKVAKRLRVGIVSTGSELARSARNRASGKIVDINRLVLGAMVQELGAQPVDLGIVKDQESAILAALREGLRKCDVVVTTAGSSVGKRDLVSGCVGRLGKPGMLVHGVAMRPSLPTGLAIVREKPVLLLPGFPVSAIFAFRVFGRPLIAKLMGTTAPRDPTLVATLKGEISGLPGYRTFIRVSVRRTPEGLVAEPLKIQRSSVLMSMVAANGIVTIPERVTSIEVGQAVEVSVVGEIPS